VRAILVDEILFFVESGQGGAFGALLLSCPFCCALPAVLSMFISCASVASSHCPFCCALPAVLSLVSSSFFALLSLYWPFDMHFSC
jgi:hypothetical protein